MRTSIKLNYCVNILLYAIHMLKDHVEVSISFLFKNVLKLSDRDLLSD